MSVLVDENTRLLVQGITGREGRFHALQAVKYGTQVVGGVTPGKGGTTHEGIPVFNTVEEARRTSDLGDVLVVWPEFQFHSTLQGVRPGKPVPEGFVYSSDRAEPRLDLDATRAKVERVA